MNQDSSFPPMLPPSTELGALLFAVLPCLREPYRPLASFAYHMTELTKIKTAPSMPSLSNLHNVEALISDKDALYRSLSYYGKLFRMPLLSTVASILQALQLYNTYKDLLPGLFSAMGGGEETSSSDNITGLFSGLGGLSPELLSSLFSGFSDTAAPSTTKSSESQEETSDFQKKDDDENIPSDKDSFDLYDSLYSFLTPEQKEIYEQLMNTD